MILSKDRGEDVDFEDDELDESSEGDDYLGDDYADDFDVGDGGLPPMEKHKDLLKGLTNFSPYIRETVNNWLGLHWDEKVQSLVRDDGVVPVMNKQGAIWCVGVLKTYVRDNNILTHISHDDYKNMISDIISNIWLNLGTRKELGIKNHGDLLRVCNELQHSAELCLMGAGGGKYSDLLSTTVNRNESVNLSDVPRQGFMPQELIIKKDKGLLGRIKQRLVG